ncbi:MAG: hypothetical protein WKH64_06930 [Chloroflexia bacterium]
MTQEAPRLEDCISGLKISERHWNTVESRVGFGGKLTFESIGSTLGGLTRQRVQQIDRDIRTRINLRLDSIEPAIEVLQTHVEALWEPFDKQILHSEAVRRCQDVLRSAGWETPSEVDVVRLILSVRALSSARLRALEERAPFFSMAACALEPAIPRHVRVGAEVQRRDAEEKVRSRTVTYEDLAVVVLLEANTPLHWVELAERAQRIGRRTKFHGSTFHNMLQEKSDRFARVGQGTYGLIAWGLTTVETYPDILADVLKREGMPLTYGKLYQSVNALRVIEPSSFTLFLSQHPRFYRSEEGTYGLRSWLAPPEQQTAGTPACLVEDLKSFSRVQRAVARGYNVNGIVESDRA